MKNYKRAIKLKLFLTKTKQKKVKALIEAYRKAVNFYLTKNDLKLNKQSLVLLQNTKLSERYKSNALKQAISISKSSKTKNKKFSGFPILDAKFVDIQNGNNSFDLWIKLSTLSKGKRIYLPTKKHKRLNYWLSKGDLIQGCELHEDKIIVWVEIEKQDSQNNRSIGIDLGMNKLITTNDGKMLGKSFSLLNDKILRKQKNSLAYKRAIREKDNYINQEINKLNWENIDILCYENLRNLTKGHSKRRKYKKFRVKQQHWTWRKIISRILEKCEENRVRPIYVNPYNTSRTCPICNNVDEANRTNEDFCCLNCGYKQDADIVGATNILNKGLNWLGSLESPNSKSCNI
jgi:putative transposase